MVASINGCHFVPCLRRFNLNRYFLSMYYSGCGHLPHPQKHRFPQFAKTQLSAIHGSFHPRKIPAIRYYSVSARRWFRFVPKSTSKKDNVRMASFPFAITHLSNNHDVKCYNYCRLHFLHKHVSVEALKSREHINTMQIRSAHNCNRVLECALKWIKRKSTFRLQKHSDLLLRRGLGRHAARSNMIPITKVSKFLQQGAVVVSMLLILPTKHLFFFYTYLIYTHSTTRRHKSRKQKQGGSKKSRHVATNTCYSKRRSLWICKHLLIMDDSHGLHFLSPILPQLVCENSYNFQLYTFVLAQVQRIRMHLEYRHTQSTREEKGGLYTVSSWPVSNVLLH